MKDRDTSENKIFNISLEIITNKIEKIVILLESITITGSIKNSAKLVEFKNELNSIKSNIIKIFKNYDLNLEKLTRFSLVIYYIINTIFDYINKEILIDNKNIKVLKLEDEHIKKFNNYIKALKVCIDKTNN